MRRLALAAALLLAACASPAERITEKLVEAGVPDRQAQCMGTRLAERLTAEQLRELGKVAGNDRAEGRRSSLRDLVRRVRDVNDPQLVAVLVGAGVECAI